MCLVFSVLLVLFQFCLFSFSFACFLSVLLVLFQCCLFSFSFACSLSVLILLFQCCLFSFSVACFLSVLLVLVQFSLHVFFQFCLLTFSFACSLSVLLACSLSDLLVLFQFCLFSFSCAPSLSDVPAVHSSDFTSCHQFACVKRLSSCFYLRAESAARPAQSDVESTVDLSAALLHSGLERLIIQSGTAASSYCEMSGWGCFCLFPPFFLRSSIGGGAYVTVCNSPATSAAKFRLRGYKRMLVIFVFP